MQTLAERYLSGRRAFAKASELGLWGSKDCRFAHDAGDATRARAEKTLLCKFFLQKRCQKHGCRFAHGEETLWPLEAMGPQEEKRRACKQIPCSFEATKVYWP